MDKTRQPTKTEIAEMIVRSDMGYSHFAIGKAMERSQNTVKKYLETADHSQDAMIAQLIEQIKRKELDELTLLGAKARARLNDLLDEGKTKPIETCAIMDRTFQQRRLLEGQSTANISYADMARRAEDIGAEIAKLKAKLGDTEADDRER